MAEYIEREVAVSKLRMEQSSHQTLRERMSVNEAVAVIEEMPAADVAPVVHGRWEFTGETLARTQICKCSVCGRRKYVPDDKTVDDVKILAALTTANPYCNCGAKMDGGTE